MVMHIEVEPIKPHIGARVHVDRATLFDKETGQRCRELLEAHGVLVFPRIGLSDAEQLAFTDNLGERINLSRSVPGANPEAPEVYKVTLDPKINEQPEYVQGTFFWHMDGITTNAPPPKATLLTGRSIAAKGGHTEFASTYAAYDHLPEDEKAEIAGLRVLHSVPASIASVVENPSEEDVARWNRAPVNEHPLVWTHETGRKSLVIGSTADRVIGMTLAEGRALLVRMVEWAAQPDFSYRHHWEEGDLVVWDNTGSLHRVIPYDKSSGRMMHRTAIAGHEPVN
jgi:alpha-ketoglutarate-dependent taurine dioxygenase